MQKVSEHEHEPLVSAIEVAEMLGLSRAWVHARAADGTLPSYRAGRRVLFRMSEIEGWLRKHATGPAREAS